MPKEYIHFPDTNENDLSSSPLLPAIGQTINITGGSTAQGKHTISACNPGKDRIKPNGSHRFIHISDTEIFNTENQEDWANNIRDYAANENISFIIHTGDICYENGLKNHIHLMNTSNMDCPMFYCIGNHDLVKGKYGEEVFENEFTVRFIIPSTSEMSTTSLHQWQEEIISPAIQKKMYTAG